jgi:hypothetical protein
LRRLFLWLAFPRPRCSKVSGFNHAYGGAAAALPLHVFAHTMAYMDENPYSPPQTDPKPRRMRLRARSARRMEIEDLFWGIAFFAVIYFGMLLLFGLH